jgi:hypothetical protein
LSLVIGQVGHPPDQSPYRDILLSNQPVFFFGRLSADRGRVGAGFSNARTFGARYEIPAGRALIFQFTVAYLDGDRFIINPQADSMSPQRRTGPFPAGMLLTDAGLQLRLGIRWYPRARLMIDADVRAQLWRLRYPLAFRNAAPDGSRVLTPDQPITDWTLHPWISLGIGWTF